MQDYKSIFLLVKLNSKIELRHGGTHYENFPLVRLF